MTITALVGAQFGSEGKGAIAAKIADQYLIHVRTGAPNAGHTYYIDDPRKSVLEKMSIEAANAAAGVSYIEGGEPIHPATMLPRIKVVARSVPVGISNIHSTCVIGPGGLIDVDLLLSEIKELDSLGLNASNRVLVDRRALVIDPIRHHQFEGGTTGEAHRKIGSTGEGVGLARMAHINRTALMPPDMAWAKIDHAGDPHVREKLEAGGVIVHYNTSEYVHEMHKVGMDVLLEGTQGSGLSSVHGPWPYCTSTDTNAAQLLVDAGISPLALTSVILVARTFPIRVAGNSGPLLGEIAWADLDVEPETTTVTKKVRRVGAWDHSQFASALMLNGPVTKVAVTFMDYIDPACKGVEGWHALGAKVHDWIWQIESTHDAWIGYVGTGPDSVVVRR